MKNFVFGLKVTGIVASLALVTFLPALVNAQPGDVPPTGNVNAQFDSLRLGDAATMPEFGGITFGMGGGFGSDDAGEAVDVADLWANCGAMSKGAVYDGDAFNCQTPVTLFSSLDIQGTLMSSFGFVPFLTENVYIIGNDGDDNTSMLALGSNGVLSADGVPLTLSSADNVVVDSEFNPLEKIENTGNSNDGRVFFGDAEGVESQATAAGEAAVYGQALEDASYGIFGEAISNDSKGGYFIGGANGTGFGSHSFSPNGLAAGYFQAIDGTSYGVYSTVDNGPAWASSGRFDNLDTFDEIRLGTATNAVDIVSGMDATGAANTGAIEIDNSLRLDANEIITNTNTGLYLQHDNNGNLYVDKTTLIVDSANDRVGVGGAPAPSTKLDVHGHLRSNSFGGLTTLSGPNYTLADGGSTSYTHSCTNAKDIPLNCGWYITPTTTGEYVVYYSRSFGNACYIAVHNYSGANITVSPRTTCLNPDA